MKTKQNGKKLELRKITIANLDKQEMRMVQGGGSTRFWCLSTLASACCV